MDKIRIGEEARLLMQSDALTLALAEMKERVITEFLAATSDEKRLECQADLKAFERFSGELSSLKLTGELAQQERETDLT